MEQTLTVKKATTAVIRHRGKIFIGQRVKDGLWELPGGRINEHETPEECIVREIKEELDINVSIVKFLCKLRGTFRDIPMYVYAYLVDWKSGELEMRVHSRIQWVNMNEINNYSIVEEDMVILKQFRHILKTAK